MTSILKKTMEVADRLTESSGSTAPDAKAADMAKHTIDVHAKGNYQRTDYGEPVDTVDDSLKVVRDDRTGPTLLEDSIARERISHFDHERIPERVVHARGAGAFGTFKLFESAEDVSLAGVLTDTSRETPVFLRFSTVLGSRGSADTVRDVRGFAVKFYTDEGNWDIVGNDIPVFFIQDAIKFVDLVHAAKPEPNTEVSQAQSAHNNFWDFTYLHEEATHMVMWAMSDRGIPRSYRMMQGFGVNTYALVNKQGQRNFVKFHFTPELGVHQLVWDEALKLAGQDPDFHRKDLYEAISLGHYPRWKFGIQVIPENRQDDFEFDILDATKIWPEDLVPIRYIGQLELNRNVDEYFTQTEQAAFCTSHIVPGIEFSDDPLLHGRNFSYFDTQISRLGPNWQNLPVNRPVCPVMNFNRDAQGQHKIHKGTVNYWPNRYEAIPPAVRPAQGPEFSPQKVAGIKARAKSKKFAEHIKQAQMYYNSLAPHEKSHLQAAISFELDHCDDQTVYSRWSDRLADIDLSLAQNIASMVGADHKPTSSKHVNNGQTAKGISMTNYVPATIVSRRVALIIGDGYNAAILNTVHKALLGAGAIPYIIGAERRACVPKGESTGGIKADHHLEGMRSTMFDAVFVPDGDHVKTLRSMGRATQWVREAFCHCKAVGATGNAIEFLQDAFKLPGVKFAGLVSPEVTESYGVVTAGTIPAETATEVVKIAKEGTGFLEQFFYSISAHRNWQREMDGLITQLAY